MEIFIDSHKIIKQHITAIGVAAVLPFANFCFVNYSENNLKPVRCTLMRYNIFKTRRSTNTLLLVLFIAISYLFILLWYNPAVLYYLPRYYLSHKIIIPNTQILPIPTEIPFQLVNTFAGFIHHIFFYPKLASLIIVIFLTILFLSTKAFIKLFANNGEHNIISFLPIILVIYDLNKYDFSFWNYLPVLFLLVGFYLYAKLPFKNSKVKIILFLVLSVFLFMFDTKTLMPFVVICMLYELFSSKFFYLPLIFLTISCLLPLIINALFYQNSVLNFYSKVFNYVNISTPILIIYLFLILIAFIIGYKVLFLNSKKIILLNAVDKLNLFVQFFVVLAIATSSFYLMKNNLLRDRLYLRYYDATDQWNNVLEISKKIPTCQSNLESHLIYRALAHKGVLLKDMLSYNCIEDGIMYLFNHQKIGDNSLDCWIYSSKTLLETGKVNKVENNMHEALTTLYYYPQGLKNMAKVYMLKENFEMAKVYLNILKEDFINRKWAQEYLDKIETRDDLFKDKELNSIKNAMHIFDTTTYGNAKNAMFYENQCKLAFEQSMALNLFYKKLEDIVNNLEYFKKFEYKNLPPLIDEAVYFHFIRTQKKFNSFGYKPTIETLNRYKELDRILKLNKLSLKSAKPYLQKSIGNSYFYYYIYAQ